MFENAEQVAGFPVSVSLQDPDTVRLDAIGIQGIKVLDDCILVSAADSTGCILAYEKQDFSRRGHGFINVGRGPGEVLVNREGNNFIFFSWEGKPLARVVLPDRALSFDIDVEERQLYVVGYEDESILRYTLDLSGIIES